MGMTDAKIISRYQKSLVSLWRHKVGAFLSRLSSRFYRSLSPSASDAMVHSLERIGAPPVLRMVPFGWRYSEVVTNRILISTSCSVSLAESGNLQSEEYSWPNRNLWELENVTLDVKSGNIFARDHVLDLATNRYRSARDAAFISGSARRVASESKMIEVNGRVATLGDTHHYYHFLIESLPKILYIQEHFPDTKFLTCDPIQPFAIEALEAFSVQFEIAGAGAVIKADSVIAIDQSPYLWPNPSEIQMLRSRIQKLQFRDFEPSKSKNRLDGIYISRSKSSRSIQGESELESLMRERGIEPVHLQDYSFIDQAGMMKDRDRIFGFHGAGLANMVFLEEGSLVTEVSTGEQFEECFRRLANACGMVYRLVPLPSSEREKFGAMHEGLLHSLFLR